MPIAFIRKVGRGKTLAGNLDAAEARSAFSLLLEGRFTPAQAGAFLQALRIKELTQVELDALLEILLKKSSPLPPLPSGGLTLNLASDTPRKGGYASLIAAAFLAEAGTPVGVVHSDPMLSGNQESWGGTLRICPSSVFHVADVYDFIPALRALAGIRGELGFRSCLHTAEKMLNPWPDKPLILGISHRHYAERMAESLRRRGAVGKIVLGNHGTPDLALHKATEVWEVSAAGEIRVMHLHPADVELQLDPNVYSLAFFPQWEEEMAREDCGALGPILRYHLAFLRYSAGEVPDVQTGLEGLDAMLSGRRKLSSPA